jgi:hypothetical protein
VAAETVEQVHEVGEISGSHGGKYEDDCLLGCCAMQSDRSLPMFQRCMTMCHPTSAITTASTHCIHLIWSHVTFSCS